MKKKEVLERLYQAVEELEEYNQPGTFKHGLRLLNDLIDDLEED
jgi:hypothetical protein